MKSIFKKKFMIIPISIIAFVLLIITITTIIMNYTMNLQFYDMKGDQIATINHIVGKRKISQVQSETLNNVLSKQFTYYGMESPIDDVQKYIDYLVENESFTLYSNKLDPNIVVGKVLLGKKSPQKGKDVLITIEYDIGAYQISLKKAVN